jgi:hypothetical protein
VTRSFPLLAASAGLLAAAAVLAVSSGPLSVAPGSAAWTRLVRGAGPGGTLGETAVIRLPGLDRRTPRLLLLEAEAAGGGAAALGVAFDAGALQWLRTVPGTPAAIVLPAAPAPGAHLTLRRAPGSPAVRLLSLRGQRPRSPRPWLPMAIAFAGSALLAAFLRGRLGPVVALAAGLVGGASIALAFTPALVWMTWPGSWMRLVPVALALAGAAAIAVRLPGPRRRELAFTAAVTAAFVFGAAARAWFMPSAGSSDTEYWKGWTARAYSHGLTQVYGDAEPFEWQRFGAMMRGAQPLPRVPPGLTIDYPPLNMALLRLASAFATPAAAGLDGSEAQNVVVKALPVFGDVGAVAFLLLAFRGTPARALALAAVYWAAPPTWINGAVLGYLDGASAPLVAAALWMAGRGRAAWTGALLAAAALMKTTCLLVLPAAAVALWIARASLLRGVLAGLAVVAAALLPFLLAGTAPLAIAQVFRAVFQRTLSGGFPNLWWIAGHLVTVSEGGAWSAPVRFVRQDAVAWPLAPVALGLFALAAAWILRAQRRVPGPRAAELAGAALVLAYAGLALGVHENHPFVALLLLASTGLWSRRLQVVAAAFAASYTASLLLLSGLGRFYGPRHMIAASLSRFWPTLRVWPGFDLTLLLAALNLALLATILWLLPVELRRAEEEPPGYHLAA